MILSNKLKIHADNLKVGLRVEKQVIGIVIFIRLGSHKKHTTDKVLLFAGLGTSVPMRRPPETDRSGMCRR